MSVEYIFANETGPLATKPLPFSVPSFIEIGLLPVLMGVLNLTPDSFSDGGLHNSKKLSYHHAKHLINSGCKILDIGGESTRPGAKDINTKVEWKRIKPLIKKIKKLNNFISLDTRKSWIMEKGIKNNVNLINDVSGFNFDQNTSKIFYIQTQTLLNFVKSLFLVQFC